MLTSTSSPSSRLGERLVLRHTGVQLVPNRLPADITRQSGDSRAHEAAIEEQKRAKQICDADRDRFRRLYDDELRRKGSDKTALEALRIRQEQRVKDDQLREIRKLARRLEWQEQRLEDDRLLERYRQERLRDRELRKLGRQQDAQRRRITKARDKSMRGALLWQKANIETPSIDRLVS